jgi:hypothetical protein
MSCTECGLRIKKGDKFVLVGFYPGFVEKMFFGAGTGLDFFVQALIIINILT